MGTTFNRNSTYYIIYFPILFPNPQLSLFLFECFRGTEEFGALLSDKVTFLLETLIYGNIDTAEGEIVRLA